MQLALYQIDAFTDSLFSGNPAAVVLLDEWIDEKLMQNIAAENNLSETAFVKKEGQRFEIRYFTPLTEVPLCGHATLASSFVLFNILKIPNQSIEFVTGRKVELFVRKSEQFIELDFPVDEFFECAMPLHLEQTLGVLPRKAFRGKENYMLVFDNEQQIENAIPNFEQLKKYDAPVMITAPGNVVDFVSRFFAPAEGINEDPVTGSAHTTLVPYWSKQLKKNKLTAKQLSERGGRLFCEFAGERVKISGEAVHYLTGTINLKN